MNSRLKNWAETIDSFGLRERLFILVSIVGVMFLVLDTWVYQPAIKQQQHINDAAQTLQQQIAQLEQESEKFQQGDAVGDPLVRRTKRLAELEAQGTTLDASITQHLGLVVGPYQAAHMLRDILAQDSELTLLDLKTELVAQNTAPQAHTAGDTGIPAEQLEQYRLTLHLEGSYLATLRFLQKVERLPWALVSDELDLAVEKYPRARITLKLFTVGNYGGTT